MTWRHIRGERIAFKQQKIGTEIEVALQPDFRAIVKATMQEHASILVPSFGKPFAADGFGNL